MASIARASMRIATVSHHVQWQQRRTMASAATAGALVTATFVTTAGSFKAKLLMEAMPITTSNFIDLCQTGFYDGVHFHRVRTLCAGTSHFACL